MKPSIYLFSQRPYYPISYSVSAVSKIQRQRIPCRRTHKLLLLAIIYYLLPERVEGGWRIVWSQWAGHTERVETYSPVIERVDHTAHAVPPHLTQPCHPRFCTHDLQLKQDHDMPQPQPRPLHFYLQRTTQSVCGKAA